MAFCTNCGQQLSEHAKFCASCGVPVEINAAGTDTERKIVFEGEVHKCPNCGEVLEAFVTKCSACGYELRGAKNSNAVREFATKLEQIENKRITNKGLVGGFKKISGFGRVSPIDEQKISLIRSFAIPNTKEDIYEFMIMASSNIDLKLYGLAYTNSFQGMLSESQRAVSDAWLAKFEQAYQKATFTFGGSQEFLNISSLYQQKMKELKWKKMQFPLLIAGMVFGVIFSMLFSFIAIGLQ